MEHDISPADDHLEELASMRGLMVEKAGDFQLFKDAFELGRKWQQWHTESQEAYDLDDEVVMPSFDQWLKEHD